MDGGSIAGGDGSSGAGPATVADLDQGAEDEQMAREFRWLLKEEVCASKRKAVCVLCLTVFEVLMVGHSQLRLGITCLTCASCTSLLVSQPAHSLLLRLLPARVCAGWVESLKWHTNDGPQPLWPAMSQHTRRAVSFLSDTPSATPFFPVAEPSCMWWVANAFLKCYSVLCYSTFLLSFCARHQSHSCGWGDC